MELHDIIFKTMTKPTSYRQIARNMKENGLSFREIAKLLGVSCTAVHTWVTKEPVVRKSTLARLERKEQVDKCLVEHPDSSIRELASFCNSSSTSVFRTLKEDLTYSKKKVYQVGTHDSERIERLRQAFSQSFRNIPRVGHRNKFRNVFGTPI